MSTFPKPTTVTTSTLPDIQDDEPAIQFKGRSFCFTGCIEGVFRQDAEEATAERGGLVKSSVVANLDYLIVSSHPNAELGKVEQALRLRERGFDIAIVYHEHWFECMVHVAKPGA